MKLASIVIVTWNNEKDIVDCLNSVKKQTYKNYEIIIVDNNSSDNSVKIIKKHFHNIQSIKNKENLGFAEGNNIGIRNSKGDYIILLNPDTVVDKNWLKELIKVAESNKKIGICQSKILLFDKKNKINTAGNVIHFLGFGYCGHYLEESKKFNKIKKINFASGASMLIKRNVLDEVGLLDKDIFLYFEDLDFSWRVLLMGYDIVVSPKSIVYHKYTFSKNNLKNYYLERNRLIVLLKNYKLKTLVLLFPAFLFMEFGLIFYSLFNGFIWYKLKSYFSFILNLKKTLIKRVKIQKIRKIGDKELLNFFSGEIIFEDLSNPILIKIVNPLLKYYLNTIRFLYHTYKNIK